MYKPDFRRKASNVPILSKQDIDHHGERFVQDFMPEAMKSPMPIDVDRFITKYLGLNLEYQYLSHCGAYLGMLVFNDTKRLPVLIPVRTKLHIFAFLRTQSLLTTVCSMKRTSIATASPEGMRPAMASFIRSTMDITGTKYLSSIMKMIYRLSSAGLQRSKT